MSAKRCPVWLGWLLKKLKDPPSWVAVLLYATTLVVCPIAVATVIMDYGHGVHAVIAYTVCALLFVYTMYVAINSIIRLRAKVLKKAEKYAFTRKLRFNPAFRTIFFGLVALVCNVGYTVFLIVMAFDLRSPWYAALAGYYVLLLATRGGVLLKNDGDEKKYKFDPLRLQRGKVGTFLYCGIMLLVLTLALAIFVALMVAHGSGFRVAQGAVYLFAAFAIYRIAMAIVNFIKAQSYEDLVARSVRYTNLAVALVSVLTLQTALMSAFPPTFDPALFTAIVGTVACLAGVALGTVMIVFSAKEKKRILALEARELQSVGTGGYNRDGYAEEYGRRN